MELKLNNQKATFDVEAVDGELALSDAKCSVDTETGDIAEFNAAFRKEKKHAGRVSYSENRGRITCNVYDVSGAEYSVLHDFVHACIAKIKAQILSNN